MVKISLIAILYFFVLLKNNIIKINDYYDIGWSLKDICILTSILIIFLWFNINANRVKLSFRRSMLMRNTNIGLALICKPQGDNYLRCIAVKNAINNHVVDLSIPFNDMELSGNWTKRPEYIAAWLTQRKYGTNILYRDTCLCFFSILFHSFRKHFVESSF